MILLPVYSVNNLQLERSEVGTGGQDSRMYSQIGKSTLAALTGDSSDFAASDDGLSRQSHLKSILAAILCVLEAFCETTKVANRGYRFLVL